MPLQVSEDAIALAFGPNDNSPLYAVSIIEWLPNGDSDGLCLELPARQLRQIVKDGMRALKLHGDWVEDVNPWASAPRDEMACVHGEDVRTCFSCAAEQQQSLA